MNWYKCHLAGENFPAELIGKSGLIGFYATRFVEADSVQQAEEQALQILRNDPELALPSGITASASSTVFFENIVMLDNKEPPVSMTPSPLAFYMMDE